MFSFFKESSPKKPTLFSYLTNKIIYPVCTAVLWTPAAATQCWSQDNRSYYLSCKGTNGSAITAELIDLAATICTNFTEAEHCYYYPNHREFGSNFYHTTGSCTLRYPYGQIPDSCTMGVFDKYAPVDMFLSGTDGVITTGIVVGASIVSFGLFAATRCFARNMNACSNDNDQDNITLLSGAEMA